jgi:chemotaxis protein CheZ
MEMTSAEREEYLAKARALVADLEAGDFDGAASAIDELTKLRETTLFQELGKLTRQLHDTLVNFRVDTRLYKLTESEIPDAKERLNHVIKMTEEAANRTLAVVEGTLPRTEELEHKANQLKAQWDRFRSRDMKVEEFRGLSREIDEFLNWTSTNATAIHGGLSEVMMAQDFQDLTGQIIRRVIKLVQDVEEGLVGLIKFTGPHKTPVEEAPPAKTKDVVAEGPQVPGLGKQTEVVAGQDDVDALLSSLGF